jgi:hypothetical protein
VYQPRLRDLRLFKFGKHAVNVFAVMLFSKLAVNVSESPDSLTVLVLHPICLNQLEICMW